MTKRAEFRKKQEDDLKRRQARLFANFRKVRKEYKLEKRSDWIA